MLKFGNKEFRNLQEQVLKNMQNIANIKEGTAVLSEFGIKVVGEVDTLADLPSIDDYKAAHPDWEYGDAFAVGTTAPYSLYILTRENDSITADHWFDIGSFPAPGPQGQQGPQGEVGPQGQQGNQGEPGVDAGFGSVLATAQTLPAGSIATATVTASGPNTAKEFSFTFGIPRGADGGNATWGNIQGTLSDQTDLQDALDAKQDELVSGTNIKTINNQSIVGAGNIEINSGVWGNIIGTLSDQTDLNAALTSKQDKIDVDHKLSATLIYGLSTVATTGDYDDLIDKPTIGTGTITIKKNGSTVDAFGVNQTTNQDINIIVPTKTSDLSNDSDFADKTYVDDGLALKQDVISDLSDIRSGAALGATAVQPATLQTELATKQDVISDLADIRSGAAAGATSVQPAAIANMVTTDTTQTISGQKEFSGQLSVLNSASFNGSVLKTSDTTDLEVEKTLVHVDWPIQDGSTYDYKATYYSNGVYIEDLEGKDEDAPYYLAFPAADGILAVKNDIGDAVLTIQKNGVTVDSFSANARANKTINITVPTNNNELTNGAGYITSSSIPTNVSAFTNDAGYITSSDIPTNYVTTDTAQTITGAKIFTSSITSQTYISGSQRVNGGIIGITKLDSNNQYGFQNKVISGQETDYDVDLYGNGFEITDFEELDENAPYYIGLPLKSGTVALTSDIPTTMSWSQITDKPTIGNAILTIQKNGTNVGTFTANAKTNKSIDITVPTNNNELTNGAGYQTASDVSTAISTAIGGLATVATTGDYDDLSNKPTILGTSTETWTFTLSDGTTTTKTIVLG